MVKLNTTNVPSRLASLIPIAERWGLQDDLDREGAVRAASVAELQELVHSIDHVSDDDLYGWLEGAESYNDHPSEEYLALTCLTMAIDSAKLRLREL